MGRELRTQPFTEEQREQIFLQAGFHDEPRAVKKNTNVYQYHQISSKILVRGILPLWRFRAKISHPQMTNLEIWNAEIQRAWWKHQLVGSFGIV